MINNTTKIFLIFILIFFSINTSFAVKESCKDKNWYPLYLCRVKTLCEKYYWDNTNNNKLDKTKIYKEKTSLENIKKIYRENQNNIYKCWILKVQEKSLLTISDLLKKDTSWTLKDKIGKKIEQRLKDIRQKIWEIKCKNKKTTPILKQSIYELCNYNSYLEYLKKYDSDIKNILFSKKTDKNKKYSITNVSNIMTNIQNNINSEITHSYKIFPLAYRAYSQYEKNYIIHELLQLIREDYIVLRNKLYSTLNPISQFIYKLANAMKMP